MEFKDIQIQGSSREPYAFVVATDRDSQHADYLWFALISMGRYAYTKVNSGKIEEGRNKESFEL